MDKLSKVLQSFADFLVQSCPCCVPFRCPLIVLCKLVSIPRWLFWECKHKKQSVHLQLHPSCSQSYEAVLVVLSFSEINCYQVRKMTASGHLSEQWHVCPLSSSRRYIILASGIAPRSARYLVRLDQRPSKLCAQSIHSSNFIAPRLELTRPHRHRYSLAGRPFGGHLSVRLLARRLSNEHLSLSGRALRGCAPTTVLSLRLSLSKEKESPFIFLSSLLSQ